MACLALGLGSATSAQPGGLGGCPTLAQAAGLPERPKGGVLRGDIDGDGRPDRATIRFAPRARASCGFLLVVETRSRALAVRVPQSYQPPLDVPVREWPWREPFVALIVRLDAHRSQVVVARQHSASRVNVSLYGFVSGKLETLHFPTSYPRDELSLYGGVTSSTQVRCWRGGPLIKLTSGTAYTPHNRRIDYRLAGNRFVIVSAKETARPTLDVNVEPFTGCVVARGRRL
jgi:hypothetical protein